MQNATQNLGRHGESLAADFLLKQGFEIMARNLVLNIGEIDILAQKEGEIVLVEVKTQKSASIIDPIYKIDPAKQRKLRQLAKIIAAKYPSQNVRIDAITVYWKQLEATPVITHLQNIITF